MEVEFLVIVNALGVSLAGFSHEIQKPVGLAIYKSSPLSQLLSLCFQLPWQSMRQPSSAPPSILGFMVVATEVAITRATSVATKLIERPGH